MGKGKKLKSSNVTADFEKFENFFYQDSHVFGIITCIADSMSESGLSFIHSDRDTREQANNMVSEYEMDTMVSERTIANMVFGNSFVVLDPAESDFDFLEQLSPRYITVQKNSDTGRHEGLKNPMILNYFLDGFFKDGSIRKENLMPRSRSSRLFTYP